MKKTLLLLGVVVVVAGCVPAQEEQIIDKCRRIEIFNACLQHIPEGPKQTMYNDWAEVVDSCESAAMYQSYRQRKNVPEICK